MIRFGARFLIVSLLSATALARPSLGTTDYLNGVFSRGEILNFSLSWLRMTGGTARMSLLPLGNDRLRIESIAESNALFARLYPVRDEIESIVTADGFSTLRFEKKLNERNKKKQELTVVDPEKRIALR